MWELEMKVQTGTSPHKLGFKIRSEFYFDFQTLIYEAAEYSALRMRQIIAMSKKRPAMTNNLESLIKLEVHDTTHGLKLGVGNIDTLNSQAPYWQVLNSGFLKDSATPYIPAHGKKVPVGEFYPGEPQPNEANFREGHWQVGEGKYSFRAKRAIQGINYITITNSEIYKKLYVDAKQWMITRLKTLVAESKDD